MKKGFIFLLCCGLTLMAMAQSKEEKVWQQVEALTKAVFDTKDSAVLNQLVSDNVTYGHSGGNLEDKRTMVHNAATSKTQYKNVVFERGYIKLDDNTAVLRHTFRAISVENGKETPLDLGILQVWKKDHGNWQLWARQAVKIPPKQ